MFAVISDIHSNLEALQTVLDDIDRRGIKTIYCLGDVIGYGANPRECLDLIIKRTKWSVLGNHDYATLYEPTNFNYAAEQASFWTRDILETVEDGEARKKYWQFLGKLGMKETLRTKLGNLATTIDFVHASPRKPVNEYLFPDDVFSNLAKIKAQFEMVKHICFIGHTHLPGVFLDEPDFYLPEELGDAYPITREEKAIINIGSVGQPRDGDNRASYAYVDENKVYFVRLEYDYKKTQEKIRKIDRLDDFHAGRLEQGR